ncbi:MAG: SAF domain-containing protein [Mycobacteriales bacterium]
MRAALRFLDRHRRLTAALCAALAVGAGLSVVAPAPAPTTLVLATARGLAAGQVISAEDLTTVAVPARTAPEGVLDPSERTSVIGRSVALPVRRGEILTDVRLSGRELRKHLTEGGLQIAPVRIADAGAVALLATGDHVDVLGAVEGLTHAVVVAADLLVVAVPVHADEGLDTASEGGALLVVAANAETARRLAQAAIASRLSVVLRA